jgi:hypothetical protein
MVSVVTFLVFNFADKQDIKLFTNAIPYRNCLSSNFSHKLLRLVIVESNLD